MLEIAGLLLLLVVASIVWGIASLLNDLFESIVYSPEERRQRAEKKERQEAVDRLQASRMPEIDYERMERDSERMREWLDKDK